MFLRALSISKIKLSKIIIWEKSDMGSHLGQHRYWFKEALYCTMWLTAVHSKLNLWLLWQNFVLFCTKQTNKNAIKWFEQCSFLFWVVELYQSHICLCSHRITSLISHAVTANIDTSNKAQSLRKGTLGVTDPVDIIVAFGVTCAWVTWCITSLSKQNLLIFTWTFQGRMLLYRVWCKHGKS